MRIKNLTDNDIEQYCESVDKLLASINERIVRKKGKGPVTVVEEDHVIDEDILVISENSHN